MPGLHNLVNQPDARCLRSGMRDVLRPSGGISETAQAGPGKLAGNDQARERHADAPGDHGLHQAELFGAEQPAAADTRTGATGGDVKSGENKKMFGGYMVRWTLEQEEFLRANYSIRGLKWCALELCKRPSQIRDKASRMGLRQDRNSDYFREWQSRAAASKVGKKRPEQRAVILKNIDNGMLVRTNEQRQEISMRMKEQWRTLPHPRGALGMKHSAETLAVLSEKSKRAWSVMPEEKRDQFAKRCASLGAQNANREGASWKAGWRQIGAIRKYYRSRWEANYARYLEWLRLKGEIQSWEHEPETFWFDGIKRGCMSYLPDFRVIENGGRIVYHEVKGWMDDRSKTKIKRMAKYHPTVELLVIDAKIYKSIAKMMCTIIEGWER